MKRHISLLTLLLILVTFCACSASKNVEASKKAISIGTRCIGVLDDYIDGKMGREEASNIMEELQDRMSYASEYAGKDNTAEQTGDLLLYFTIVSTAWDVYNDGYYGNVETYEKVIEDRNKIAEFLGMDAR